MPSVGIFHLTEEQLECRANRHAFYRVDWDGGKNRTTFWTPSATIAVLQFECSRGCGVVKRCTWNRLTGDILERPQYDYTNAAGYLLKGDVAKPWEARVAYMQKVFGKPRMRSNSKKK